MRQIKLTLLLTPLLIGCSTNQIPSPERSKDTFDYSDFKDINLDWENLFSPAKSLYFVYIFSVSCGHCERIKQMVLEEIDEYRDIFYITEFKSQIPITTNAKETLGKEETKEISILGTPTLLGVTNKYLSLNIAGEKEILEYLALLPHSEKNG